MPTEVPPVPPVTLSDEGPLRRVHFRLWQIVMTALTILGTAWCFTLGALPGIIAVLFAKHILVAVLAVGLRLPPQERPPHQAAG
jgi:hypothetical protein